MRDIFLVRQAIVGMRYLGGAGELVKGLGPGSRIIFVTEPGNRYDEHAVMALDEQGRKLGYIPRHENQIIRALLKAGKGIYGILLCCLRTCPRFRGRDIRAPMPLRRSSCQRMQAEMAA